VPGLTVNEVVLAFLRHADRHYRRADGTLTDEPELFRLAARPLCLLYGHTPAAEFGPLTLKAVRQRMVDDGLSRPVVNARVGRLRRVLKWAASEELIPFEAYYRLTVAGLGKGGTPARELEPVGPVPPDHVAATLSHLGRQVGAMVRL
jgi:hypothetical protein